MVVILAGCDGTGKTTCFRKLKESVDANFIKESYTKSSHIKTIRVEFTVSKIDENDLTIYDRATLLDDLVYEKVMANRESDLIETFSRSLITKMLNSCVIIYFDLDNEVLNQRLEERGDKYITSHQINKIKRCYDETFETFNVQPVKLNVTGLNEDQVYTKVKEIIDEKLKDR